ncbi:MAG: hypothetical protein K0V04_28420 [Deltaproteobacteria bacterium]|nr:hypothetical protein [Deltaproteobacteria bacterium]
MGGAVAIAIVAGVATLAVVVARGGLSGARFTINVRGPEPDDIRIKGNVPGHATNEVAAFIADLELPKGSKVWGIPDGERVSVQFSSEVPEFRRQRLRNFFYLKQ